MFLDNKLLFVAGGAGMAGSSIMQHVLDKYPTTRIRATYYKNTKPFIKHKRLTYVYCDLKSQNECKKAIKVCDGAIMAAAYTGGSGFVTSKQWAHSKENLMMNIQMLDAFLQANIKRIVYIGSATLYQDFQGNIKEDQLNLNDDPCKAYLGFGWGTRLIEKFCRFLHEQYKIEIVIGRVSNIFGPYAKFDPRDSNFIPAIIRKAVDKADPFEVWGGPDVVRDVIYSDDFARAIAMMMDNDEVKFDIFNIGSGVKTTVGEVVRLALKYSGHNPAEVRYASNRPKTSDFRILDCSKAERILGWRPQYTVEDGIKLTTEWWIKNKGWWKK